VSATAAPYVRPSLLHLSHLKRHDRISAKSAPSVGKGELRQPPMFESTGVSGAPAWRDEWRASKHHAAGLSGFQNLRFASAILSILAKSWFLHSRIASPVLASEPAGPRSMEPLVMLCW
jgi:hypothetical protein